MKRDTNLNHKDFFI